MARLIDLLEQALNKADKFQVAVFDYIKDLNQRFADFKTAYEYSLANPEYKTFKAYITAQSGTPFTIEVFRDDFKNGTVTITSTSVSGFILAFDKDFVRTFGDSTISYYDFKNPKLDYSGTIFNCYASSISTNTIELITDAVGGFDAEFWIEFTYKY
jgi:hypothetical protein